MRASVNCAERAGWSMECCGVVLSSLQGGREGGGGGRGESGREREGGESWCLKFCDDNVCQVSFVGFEV